MDEALNIFRGTSIPVNDILDVNPVYKSQNRLYRIFWKHFVAPALSLRIRRFSPMYNLPYAALAKQNVSVPVICVGGFRNHRDMAKAIHEKTIDFVGLCRPFIAEPDLVEKLRQNSGYTSRCFSCNRCSIMCDSGNPTKCCLSR
jgi:2,4-dienoyl-CoA reductase-like NADH-dependent reductase (Old Yellow Enzyme family)